MKYFLLFMVAIPSFLRADSYDVLMEDYLNSLPVVERDLYEAIEAVAKKNNVTVQQVTNLFKENLLNSAYWPSCGKGSYATLGNDTYVKTKSLNNEVLYHENEVEKSWVGKKIGNSELLIMENGSIKHSQTIEVTNKNIQLVLFEPERVSYFDWGDTSGGYYERNCK